jgi:hypothetical protein
VDAAILKIKSNPRLKKSELDHVYKSQVALVDEALADVKKKLEKQRVVEEQVSPGPNPTTSIYNADIVKIYNTTNTLARFGVKIIFLRFKTL